MMKMHIEYDGFEEYVEAVNDREMIEVKDCERNRWIVELILFEGTGVA